MKKIKVSILALSVLVGGAVLASADTKLTLASTEDIALTNAVPLIWSSVSTVPTSLILEPTNGFSFNGVVDTDSGGKISGVGNAIKIYSSGSGTNTTVIGGSSWYVTVKGNITASQMGVPSVNMTLKGSGYTAPSVSNQVIVVNNKSDTAFPGSLSLTFKATKTAAISNNFAYHILGNLKGTIKPGLAAVNTKSINVNEPADLVVSLRKEDTLDFRVIVFGNKFAAIMGDYHGQGNVSKNNGTYTLNLKPAGGGNSSLQLKGTIVAVPVVGTNGTTIATLNTADVKGKIQGQAVQSTGYRFAGFQ